MIKFFDMITASGILAHPAGPAEMARVEKEENRDLPNLFQLGFNAASG